MPKYKLSCTKTVPFYAEFEADNETEARKMIVKEEFDDMEITMLESEDYEVHECEEIEE